MPMGSILLPADAGAQPSVASARHGGSAWYTHQPAGLTSKMTAAPLRPVIGATELPGKPMVA